MPVSELQQPLTIQHPIAHPLQQGIDSLVQYFNTHASLIVLIWFMLFLARFVQLLSGMVYTQRIRHYQTHSAPVDWQQRLHALLERMGITRPVSLLQSGIVKTPTVIGFLKPVILMPIGMLMHLAPEQLESILLHELAHIRRRDYLFNVVQHLIDTLFFFNPALIWISSLIRNERENCCDDVAIRETQSRRRLIEALVSFHKYEQSGAGYALAFAGKENQVVKRVRRIVDKKNRSLHAGERALLMGGLLILSAAFITIRGSRPEPMPVLKAKTAPAEQKRTISIHKDLPHTVSPIHQTNAHPATPAQRMIIPPVEQTDTVPDLFRNASVDKWIECKDHGVTPEFVEALQKMGYRNFTLDQAIQLKDHGVRLEFITRLKDLGYANVPMNKLIDLVDHGVTAEYIAGMKKKMGTQIDLSDYIRLRDAGINPS